MKNILINLRIRNLKKKGYESFTITENGIITAIHFYKVA
jgi:hypothetical protein